MKIIGGNSSPTKLKLFEISSYIAAFSPLYLKYIIGYSYLTGLIAGGVCAWGFNNIYNKLPFEEEKNTFYYKSRKKKKIKKLIATLKQIEQKKRKKI